VRKLGNQLAIKDKGMRDRSPRALRDRQANPHSFFQLRTIWVVTAARKRVAKGDIPTAFFDLRTTRVVTHLRICRHVPPKVERDP